MPQGVDFTAEFREAGVDGYVLIGEAWDGCVGHNWEVRKAGREETETDEGRERMKLVPNTSFADLGEPSVQGG